MSNQPIPNHGKLPENRHIPGNFVDAAILLLEAKQKIDSQKIKEGLDILHHITLLYPDYARTYNLLGWVYDSLLDDNYTAEKYYKKCLDLNPDFKEIYSNYGFCLLVLKKYTLLEEFLIKSLQESISNKPYLYHLLGKAQEALKKFDLAIESYETSILHSFDSEDISAREKDIERCIRKRNFVNKKQKLAMIQKKTS